MPAARRTATTTTTAYFPARLYCRRSGRLTNGRQPEPELQRPGAPQLRHPAEREAGRSRADESEAPAPDLHRPDSPGGRGHAVPVQVPAEAGADLRLGTGHRAGLVPSAADPPALRPDL